jgi:hypothetical protein
VVIDHFEEKSFVDSVRLAISWAMLFEKCKKRDCLPLQVSRLTFPSLRRRLPALLTEISYVSCVFRPG